MCEPIKEEEIGKYQESMRAASALGRSIGDRVDYIIRELYPKAILGFEIDWYGFEGVSENFEGDLFRSLHAEYVTIDDHCTLSQPDYSSPEGHVLSSIFPEIPIEYLYWKDEDVLGDIVSLIEEEEEVRRALTKRRSSAKVKKDMIAQQALAKLSAEERQALGIKK